MKRNLIVFDLDGTLADTIEGIMHSANIALARKGFQQHDRDFYVRSIGGGARTLIARALHQLDESDEQIDDVLEDFLENYADDWSIGLVLYEGIKSLISDLKKQGHLLAVNTNKPHSMALDVVNYLFDPETFIDVRGAHTDYPKKPDVGGLNLIKATAGGHIDRCIYIGDSEVDMNTAINAKVDFIGVDWGYGHFSSNADFPIADNARVLREVIADD